MQDALTDCTGIDRETQDLLQDLEIVMELIQRCVEENSRVAQDQDEYLARYNGAGGTVRKSTGADKGSGEGAYRADGKSGCHRWIYVPAAGAGLAAGAFQSTAMVGSHRSRNSSA